MIHALNLRKFVEIVERESCSFVDTNDDFLSPAAPPSVYYLSLPTMPPVNGIHVITAYLPNSVGIVSSWSAGRDKADRGREIEVKEYHDFRNAGRIDLVLRTYTPVNPAFGSWKALSINVLALVKRKAP